MALFDVQAALAEILGGTAATVATPATNPASVASVAAVAPAHSENAAPAEVLPFVPPPYAAVPSRKDADTFRHGRSVTGLPKTWTGRVVSLDQWRNLSAWDRHGPDGRLWCGACRAWVRRCRHIDALDRN